jgi:hypothetical protein
MKIPVEPPQRTDLQIEAKTFRKITTSRYITTFAIATSMKEKHNIAKYRSDMDNMTDWYGIRIICELIQIPNWQLL